MAANNFATGRFFLVRCLLATAVIALIGCRGARAAPEAGNATVAQQCHGGECLIAYRQPEVELMAVLDPEHALGSMLATINPGDAVKTSRNSGQSANCGRGGPGRYTPCLPQQNSGVRYSPYNPRKA